MSNSVPLTFRAAPFPEGYKSDPEGFKNDLVARLYAESSESIAFFASGTVAPTSNVGPWLKNGTEWYVWDNGVGGYVPQAIGQSSLKFAVQFGEPDHTLYLFWIELDAGGVPQAVKTYNSGAWVDVYAVTLANYQTIAAMSSYPTTAQMNSAIAAATYASYVAQGVTGGVQVIPATGTATKVQLTLAAINPSPAPFDTSLYRYTAPAQGNYLVSASCQVDNNTADAATVQVLLMVYKNGVFVGNAMADLDSTPSPNGLRWSPGFSGLVALLANDYIELFISVTDQFLTGSANLSVAQMSVNRVSS